MKKIIVLVLLLGSFGIAFAHIDYPEMNTTRVFNQDPFPLNSGQCIVSHFVNDGSDPRYHECVSKAISKDRCMATKCDSQNGAPVSPVVPIALTPSQLNRRTPQYLAGLRALGRQIGAANTPVFRPSGSSAYVLTLKAELFGIVFRNCPADSAETDLKNDYIVVKVSDGQPPYSITTPGYVSEFRRVEGNASYWGIRVATPRYEATRIPLSIRDAVGQVKQLSAQAYACPS